MEPKQLTVVVSFRKAGHQVVDQICDYYETLSQRPVVPAVQPGFLAKSIAEAAPEEPEEWEAIFRDFQNVILPGATHWQHPRFFAYFPSNASKEGILADMLSASISSPGFNWNVAPSATELEIIMCDWVVKMLGLSDVFLSTSPSGSGGGVILGSASEVCLTVAIAARERALTWLAKTNPSPSGEMSVDRQMSAQISQWRGDLTSKLVMYGTTQTHSIGLKAAIILGLDFRAVEVKAEDNYALRASALEAAMKEDLAAGRLPFMLIASLGTTSSGAVDDLTEIVEVARRHPVLWVHVDAAYAGVALALPECREPSHLVAINALPCHSFSTNYHKWGLTQFDCSPLLVRDRGDLTRALTVTPEYLRTKQGDAGSVLDLRNMQISLGRRFRSLKLWFVIRSFGLQGFRAHIRRTINLAQEFEDSLRTRSDLFEIVIEPRCALRVFRLRERPEGSETADSLNHRFWDALLEHTHEMLLTQTVLPGVGFCIRFCVGTPSSASSDVQFAFNRIVEIADRLI